jgi:hypothetical protein
MKITLWSLLMTLACNIFSQENKLYNIRLKNDEVIIGSIVLQNKEYIILKSDSLDERRIAKKNIAKKEVIYSKEDSIIHISRKLLLYNTNVIASPTALPLEKGTMSYENKMFVFNKINYALVKGLVVDFNLYTSFDLKGFLGIKYSAKVSEKLFLGAKYFPNIIGIEQNDFGSNLGIFSGFMTYGDVNNNVTLGYGSELNIKDKFGNPSNSDAYFINGTTKLYDKYKICFESLLGDKKTGYSYLGVRRNGKHLSLNFGAVFGYSNGIFDTEDDVGAMQLFPYLGVSVPLLYKN